MSRMRRHRAFELVWSRDLVHQQIHWKRAPEEEARFLSSFGVTRFYRTADEPFPFLAVLSLPLPLSPLGFSDLPSFGAAVFFAAVFTSTLALALFRDGSTATFTQLQAFLPVFTTLCVRSQVQAPFFTLPLAQVIFGSETIGFSGFGSSTQRQAFLPALTGFKLGSHSQAPFLPRRSRN